MSNRSKHSNSKNRKNSNKKQNSSNRRSHRSQRTPNTTPLPNPSTHNAPLPLHSGPVPHSRRTRNSALSRQTKKSLLDSSYNNRKRDSIENLKLGAPYNEENSFISSHSPQEIFNELTLILKCEQNLDINIHPSGFKIRGRKFIANIMCEFQIEMFNTHNAHSTYPNHILVEFQRRNGDGFVFQQFMNSVFTELQKTKLITFSKFLVSQRCHLSPVSLPMNDIKTDETKENGNGMPWRGNRIDSDTLQMLCAALFNGDCCMRRSAAQYLANNICNNSDLMEDLVRLEPLIMTKFSDLLLKCVDPQIVQSIGCTLYYMLTQSKELKCKALNSNVKMVCKKVYKRWTEPVETRYGSNNKYVIRVIPSMQVAQRMSACIQVLE